MTPYVEEVSAQFHFPRRIRVVFDAGNGTGGPVMHRILENLNVDATEMYFEMDGRFPNHHPDPTVPENLQALIDKVRETGADLGIAFDGDTDRIGAVDDRGTVIWGDQLMIIYGREILTRKPGATFIGEVKCSQIDVRRSEGARRQPHHVEDGPLADQGQDEGDARRAGRRDERPHVLRRPLLRLRRRAVLGLPPDRDRRQFRTAALARNWPICRRP